VVFDETNVYRIKSSLRLNANIETQFFIYYKIVKFSIAKNKAKMLFNYFRLQIYNKFFIQQKNYTFTKKLL